MMIKIKKVVHYIKNNDFKIIYLNNNLDVINYDKMLDVTDNIVKLIKNNHLITIHGDSLRLEKLLDKEILITGKINKIEL